MVSGQEPPIGIKVAAATVSLSEAKPNVSLKLPQAAVSLSEAPPCSSEAVRLSQAKPGGSFKAGEALPVRLRSQATGSFERMAVSGLFRWGWRAAGVVVIPVVLIRQNGAE